VWFSAIGVCVGLGLVDLFGRSRASCVQGFEISVACVVVEKRCMIEESSKEQQSDGNFEISLATLEFVESGKSEGQDKADKSHVTR
jgi:hypothetical protein